MDGFDSSTAPEEYQSLEWFANLCFCTMAIGWGTNYLGMVYKSFQDETYALPIFAICSNVAWEIVHAVIYPSKNMVETAIFTFALAVDLAVVYAAVRFAPREWGHAPLVMHNLPAVFAGAIFLLVLGYLATVRVLGAGRAYTWNAIIAQLIISVGDLCQLVNRNSSRGASYVLWLGRFLGSVAIIGAALLRWRYWPEEFAWLENAMVGWAVMVFILTDGLYGVCLWRIKRDERKKKRL